MGDWSTETRCQILTSYDDSSLLNFQSRKYLYTRDFRTSIQNPTNPSISCPHQSCNQDWILTYIPRIILFPSRAKFQRLHTRSSFLRASLVSAISASFLHLLSQEKRLSWPLHTWGDLPPRYNLGGRPGVSPALLLLLLTFELRKNM